MLITTVTTGTFDDEVLKSDRPVVVYFSMEKTPDMTETLNELSKENLGVKFVSIDAPKNLEIVNRYSIAVAPTIAVFRNGKLEWKAPGPTKKEIEEHLSITIKMN